MTENFTARVEALLDQEAIRSRLRLYCRAVDRCDEDIFLQTFHDDAVVDHGRPTEIRVFAREAARRVRELWAATQHSLGQIEIEIMDDVALSEAYLTACHLTHDTPQRMVVFGGRYIDRFERRAGQWRIARRILAKDWQHEMDYRPVTGWNFRLQRRDGLDPVYWPDDASEIMRG